MKRESERITTGAATQACAALSCGIPLIPLNPAESRFKIKFCPRRSAEPNRDRGEKSGLLDAARYVEPDHTDDDEDD